MRTQVVTGSKSEIIEAVQGIEGVIREVIVVVEEGNVSSIPHLLQGDIFAEMEPFTVRAGNADYSRQSLYVRQEGE